MKYDTARTDQRRPENAKKLPNIYDNRNKDTQILQLCLNLSLLNP
jgi:hypothetical protein